MALHRDIYWVGRQWAVTGYGVQACDQRQKSKFDIEASQLWEEDVLNGIRALQWLNVEDFDKALSVARQRFPQSPRKIEPPPGMVEPEKPEIPNPDTVAPPKPAAPKFQMRFIGSAKFARPWRVRLKR
jgi:hypothetical protein